MSAARRRRDRGFTLIEVLVAIGIAAIGLAAVLAVVTNSAGNAGSQRTRTLASWVALNQITRTRLGTSLPAADVTKGDVEYANLKWKWEQNVTQTDVPNIRRIDVRVRLADDADDATRVTVSGFVGRAQMSSPPLATNWDQSAVSGGNQPGGTGTTGATTPGTAGSTGTTTPAPASPTTGTPTPTPTTPVNPQ